MLLLIAFQEVVPRWVRGVLLNCSCVAQRLKTIGKRCVPARVIGHVVDG